MLAGLGVVGHCVYQLCFINGLARTTVANSALISGTTPVAIALLSALVGHERSGGSTGPARCSHSSGCISWLVAARGQWRIGGGDLLIATSVLCWTVYTVFSRPCSRDTRRWS